MQLELKSLQRRLGISFIYVTHDQEEALTMSDRIVVMNSGRVEQIGRAEEIYERPSTEFVAGFIGVSNIIEGVVHSASNHTTIIRVGESRITAPSDGLVTGQRVRLLIRPEKISISNEGSEENVSGVIESAVYLGESTQWRIAIDGKQTITVLEQNKQAFRPVESRIGETVFLAWEPESAVMLEG
jgi:ABC-type Fe3+/spermidine/putrescine transport system ATPase subunit